MKIFIAYASAGSGHFKAAEAIYNYFRDQRPSNQDIELKLIDVLDKSGCWFRKIYLSGYNLMVNYAPWLWAVSFYVTYKKPLCAPAKRIHSFLNRIYTGKFAAFLTREDPDFIISTHFLPAEISAYLRKTRRINSKTISVITDFGVHPFWIYQETDIYIAASDFTKGRLLSQGIAEGAIKVLGIPINSKFLKSQDNDVLAKKLHLDKNKFTVLIVTGSFGIGPIEEIVDILYREVQILVVCARNKKLYARLKKKNYPQVLVFGFVDNLEELMAVSDIVIAKPGGLTSSEILAMERLPIFISPIPGQEEENLKVLVNYHAGREAKDIRELKELILEYKNNPQEINSIKENVRKVKKPFAAQELYNVVCKSCFRNTG